LIEVGISLQGRPPRPESSALTKLRKWMCAFAVKVIEAIEVEKKTIHV
jgi:hypothetical protein